MCAVPWWGIVRTDSTVYGMLTKTEKGCSSKIQSLHLVKNTFHNKGDVQSLKCGMDMHC